MAYCIFDDVMNQINIIIWKQLNFQYVAISRTAIRIWPFRFLISGDFVFVMPILTAARYIILNGAHTMDFRVRRVNSVLFFFFVPLYWFPIFQIFFGCFFIFVIWFSVGDEQVSCPFVCFVILCLINAIFWIRRFCYAMNLVKKKKWEL